MISFALILHVLLASENTWAEGIQKHALIWGAGCNWNHVDFSSGANELSSALSEKSWKVETSVAAITDDKPSMTGSKKALFDFLDQEINDSKVTAGSEIFLGFLAHGSESNSKASHGWALPDCTELKSDDPELLNRLAALKRKKVKLLIQDSSCYSGGSVPILGKYGCVLTSQTASEVSYGLTLPGITKTALHDSKKTVTALDLYLDILRAPRDLGRSNFTQLSGLKNTESKEINFPEPDIASDGMKSCYLGDPAVKTLVNAYDAMNSNESNHSQLRNKLKASEVKLRDLYSHFDKSTAETNDFIVKANQEIGAKAEMDISDFDADQLKSLKALEENKTTLHAYQITKDNKVVVPINAVTLDTYDGAAQFASDAFVYDPNPNSAHENRIAAVKNALDVQVKKIREDLYQNPKVVAASIGLGNLIGDQIKIDNEISKIRKEISDISNQIKITGAERLHSTSKKHRSEIEKPFSDCEDFKF